MTTCPCNNCSGRIEFEETRIGESVACPHCGMETVLFLPQIAVPPKIEPTTRKSRTGMLSAVIVGLAILTASFWIKTRSGSAPARLAPVPVWERTNTIQKGDIRVMINAKVERVGYYDSFRSFPLTDRPYLVIYAAVKNLNPTMKRDFQSWRKTALSAVTDNFGNEYKKVDIEPMLLLSKAPDSGSIYPGESFTDIVVFERPVSGIQWLNLRLPADNFDESGELRFEVPASVIKWEGR